MPQMNCFATDLSNDEQVDNAVKGSEVIYLMVGFDYNIKVWREKWPKLMRATIDACIKYRQSCWSEKRKSFLIETVYKNLKKGKRPTWFIEADKKHSFTFTPDAKATAILANTADAYNQVCTYRPIETP